MYYSKQSLYNDIIPLGNNVFGPRPGSPLDKRADDLEKTGSFNNLVKVIKKEIKAIYTDWNPDFDEDIVFDFETSLWKVRAGSFAHRHVVYHCQWSNKIIDGFIENIGHKTGQRVFRICVEYYNFGMSVSSSSKTNNFSPNAVLEAQAETVPDTVMHTVFQLLVERYLPGREAEVSTREIVHKTGVIEQKLKGLGRAFEKHGWNVKYERELGVYVFSDSDKKKKKEVPETK